MSEETFWFNDPTILMKNDKILQLWPKDSMSYNEKLNAISRLVILLTTLGLVILRRPFKIFATGFITIGIVYLLFHLNSRRADKESFLSKPKYRENVDDVQKKMKKYDKHYEKVNAANPLGNVLVTDIHDNPTRKSAPPAYMKDINKDINDATKKMIKDVNVSNKDIDKRLFRDLGDNYMFEESMIPFHTNANTQIPNDQASFADFCYGTMTSCKEGNEFACAKKDARHINY